MVLGMYAFTEIGWLWLNAIGALAVVIIAFVLNQILGDRPAQEKLA